MPALTLALNATTATTATLAIGALAADGTIDLQISPRLDFNFCVAPIYSIARASPYVVPGLNQGGRYYARARSLRADGTAEDWSNVVGFKTPIAVAQDLTVPSIVVDAAVLIKPAPIIGWTPDNEQAGYPSKNVSKPSPVAWHSIMAGDVHGLTLEHAGDDWNAVAVLMTNVPEAATFTLRAGATVAAAAAAGPLLNAVPFRASPNVPGRNGYHGYFELGAIRNERFTRIEINTGGTPAHLLHVEYVVLGRARRSKPYATDSVGQTPIHLGTQSRTRTGINDLVLGRKMRHAEFDIAFLPETQSETLYQDALGWLDEPIFAIANSKAGPFLHDRLLFGDLKGGRVSLPSNIHQTRTFVVESLI
jgi:hypothetical protein